VAASPRLLCMNFEDLSDLFSNQAPTGRLPPIIAGPRKRRRENAPVLPESPDLSDTASQENLPADVGVNDETPEEPEIEGEMPEISLSDLLEPCRRRPQERSLTPGLNG